MVNIIHHICNLAAVGVVAFGCYELSVANSAKSRQDTPQVVRKLEAEASGTLRGNSKSSFQNFGAYTIKRSNSNRFYIPTVQSITAADLNGDGRPDLIVGTDDGRVILYENQFPQKK